jgi:hypothetical protein
MKITNTRKALKGLFIGVIVFNCGTNIRRDIYVAKKKEGINSPPLLLCRLP